MECGFGEPTLIEQIVDWFGVPCAADVHGHRLLFEQGLDPARPVDGQLVLSLFSGYSGRRCRTGDEARRVLETALKRRLPDQRMRCLGSKRTIARPSAVFLGGAFQACP
jgi:hypothetical protein